MSGRRDGTFIRKERLMAIAKEIAYDLNQDKRCVYEDVILWCQYNIGLTEKKAREYVDVVVKAHTDWHLNNGLITCGEVS